MKELSIEDKAKAYDEALEMAKVAHKDEDRHLKATLERIFPELKESEDEKIRKELLNAFQESEDSLYMVLTPHRRESFIAWLEKQGEQKPNLPKWKYKSDNKPLLKDSIILNKYGCVAKSPSGALVSDVWVIDYDELVKLPKEEYNKQGEQMPADKVDSNLLTVERAKKMSPFMKTGFENESAAWSEKDENIRQWIISDIDKLLALNKKSVFIADKEINWVKSLKDRVGCEVNCTTTWKPSDEQLTWLYRAADDASKDSRMKQVLNELLSDLKKLREK